MQQVESEIAALLPLHEIPDDAQSRYDDFSEQIAAQQEVCGKLKAQWGELRTAAKKLPINEGLRRNCCRLEALSEQEGWLNSIGEHIGWLHNDIAAVETELATERDELGLGNIDWDQLPTYRDRAENELRRPRPTAQASTRGRRKRPAIKLLLIARRRRMFRSNSKRRCPISAKKA